MRLLTWNLNHRAARRHVPSWIATAIAAQTPDVIVLTEYVEGEDHEQFVAQIASIGLTSIERSSQKSGQNQILIASRYGLRRGALHAPPLHEAVPSNVLHVFLEEPGIHVLGLRMPAFAAKDRSIKRETWKWLIDAGALLQPHPSIITGDLNTALGDSVSYCGDCLEQMAGSGWHHALPASGFSWKSARHGTERRIDHAFFSPAFLVLQAKYLWDYQALSDDSTTGKVGIPDHAMLLATASRCG